MALSKPGTAKLGSVYEKELVDSVKAILENKVDGMGALTKWNVILKILWEHHIPYKRIVKLTELMVHPKNRGGLGVNPHDAHEIIAKVKRIGADIEHLRKATAFELSPFPEEQQAQRNFNVKLVERSGGLLAPISGEERLLTVACSHFSQGCRAALAGCKTPEADLKNPDGTINVQSLLVGKGNHDWKKILNEGIEFTILPAAVEQTFGPAIADLAQSALNAEHGTYSKANELQVMSSMALAAESAGGDPDWTAVANNAKAAAPPCADYLDTLVEFVKYYAGGAGAPIIGFLCCFVLYFNC